METNFVFHFRGVTGLITRRLSGGLLETCIRSHFGAWWCSWGQNRQQRPNIQQVLSVIYGTWSCHGAHSKNCCLLSSVVWYKGINALLVIYLPNYTSSHSRICSPVYVLNRACPILWRPRDTLKPSSHKIRRQRRENNDFKVRPCIINVVEEWVKHRTTAILLAAFFDPEHGGSTFLRRVGKFLPFGFLSMSHEMLVFQRFGRHCCCHLHG
jgi:hypothetical protein